MATRYFYDELADGNWDTVGNWFTDEAHTNPAGAVGTDLDDVILLSDCTSGSAYCSSLQVRAMLAVNIMVADNGADFTHDNARLMASLTCPYGVASFYAGSELSDIGEVNCDALFYGAAECYGVVHGDASFYDSSICSDGAVIDGNLALHDSAQAWAPFVGGNLTQDGDSDSSIGGGLVAGDAYFAGYSINGFSIDGNAEFHEHASDGGGFYSGNVDVYYPSPKPFSGGAAGTLTYHDYPNIVGTTFVGTVDGDWSNVGNWQDDEGNPADEVPGDGGGAIVMAVVTSMPPEIYMAFIEVMSDGGLDGDFSVSVTTIYFEDFSYNSVEVFADDAVFFGDSQNYGQVSTLNGTLFFGYAGNYGDIYGPVTFMEYTQNMSGGKLYDGPVVFTDNSDNTAGQVVTDCLFTGGAINEGAIVGDAVFESGASCFGGSVGGNATFKGDALLESLTINGSLIWLRSMGGLRDTLNSSSGVVIGGSFVVPALDVLGGGLS